MYFIIVISSLSPAVPAPPATFPPSLSSAGAEKNSTTLHHLHSIRIIIPRNALQSLREVRGTKHRGNHLPPVIISHLSAALEEDPAGLGGSHVQPTDRRTDRQRKGLMWLRCPESISDSQCFGSTAAPLGTGSTRASAFRSVCQASPYPQILKHWTCHSEDVGAFKNPKASTSWDLHHEKKSSRRMKRLTSCQDLWTLPGGVLCGTLWGSCLIAKWLCNQKFLKALKLFKADIQKKIKHWLDSNAHEVSV